jgi:hypothetical protein
MTARSSVKTTNLAWFGLFGALMLGCDSRPATYPARGTVSYAGKPAHGAIVVLLPKEGTLKGLTAHPRGEVAADGSFTLTTFVAGDGVPAGEYTLTVRWPGARTRSGAVSSAGDDPFPDRLQGRFADPHTSPWTVIIQPGENQLPPIAIPN